MMSKQPDEPVLPGIDALVAAILQRDRIQPGYAAALVRALVEAASRANSPPPDITCLIV